MWRSSAVLLYGSRKTVSSSVLADSPRATRASRATDPHPSGLVALDFSRKPPKLRLWCCTQPRAAKATAGVAVVGKMASIPHAAAVEWYTMLASGARNAPRWLPARTNSSDSQASVGVVVWYCCVTPGMGVWVCALWWGERCDGVKKNV